MGSRVKGDREDEVIGKGEWVFILVASLAALKPQAEGGVESEESRKAEQCITVTDLLCHGTPEEL